MTSAQGRVVTAIVAIMILGCMIWLVKSLNGNAAVVTSNQISSEKLNELKKSAAAGDASAQYALTLYVGDQRQAEQLLESAAKAGYPPALVTLSQALISKGGQDAERAKALLERAALQGYEPAITELIHCLDAGECGKSATTEAYAWIIVADYFVQKMRIAEHHLGEEKKRLRDKLNQTDFEEAQRIAKAIFQRM